MINPLLGRFFFRIRSLTPVPLYTLCLLSGTFDRINFYFGMTLILSGEILRLWAVGYLGIESRTAEATAKELVISGPYRVVRNPIYVGNISIYTGFAVLSNIFFPYFQLLTMAFFAVIYVLIGRYEESFLLGRFGSSYSQYMESVRAFVPSAPFAATSRAYSLQRAFLSERPTLLALAICLSGIFFRLFAWKAA